MFLFSWVLFSCFVHFVSLTAASPLEQVSFARRLHRRQISSTPGNQFAKGTQFRAGEVLDAKGSNACAGVYGVRKDGDLPFSRATRGNIVFFGKGEQNTADGLSDKWLDNGGIDDPKQSACGIPNDAYFISHVAIHPYWLKYAPLDRYCMPDVCISFWSTGWEVDMMLKVTDICDTDPSKPNSCKTPGDIKIDRTKAKIWSGYGNDPRPAEEIPGLGGDTIPQQTIWFFRKCWDDGIVQDVYDYEDNWFAKPKYYNNKEQTADYGIDQYFVNQAVYPPNLLYNQCAYNTSCQGDPIPDWQAGDPDPAWQPICGGQGFSGKPAPATTTCPDYSKLGIGGTPDVGQTAADTAACKAIGDDFSARPKGQGTFGGNNGLLKGGISSGGSTTIPNGGAAQGVGMGNAQPSIPATS